MKLLRLWRLRLRELVLHAHMLNGKTLIRETEEQLERDRKKLRDTIERLRKTRQNLALIEPPRRLIEQKRGVA